MAGEIQLNNVTLATESGGVASIDSSVNIKGPLNASGSAPIYACRAWVNFDGTFGTSPFTIANGGMRASGNVSSITDNGTGDYTVNFTTAMPDANYAVVGMSQYANNTGQVLLEGPSDASTSSFRVYAKSNSNITTDAQLVSVTVFR